MPRVEKNRTIGASPEEIWELVSDPYHLPRWWPGVERVEEVSELAWTTVLLTPKGRTVRADYSHVSAQEPERLSWRQEVEESPFERIMSEAITELSLEPAGAETLVRLEAHISLRGFSRLGVFQVGRATAGQLEGALEGIEQALRSRSG